MVVDPRLSLLNIIDCFGFSISRHADATMPAYANTDKYHNVDLHISDPPAKEVPRPQANKPLTMTNGSE